MLHLKLVKITIFDQNQFMTCYLIFDFRPTYFSYFQKITAISHSHNVKKEVDPKDPFPVVKGLSVTMSATKKSAFKSANFFQKLSELLTVLTPLFFGISQKIFL